MGINKEHSPLSISHLFIVLFLGALISMNTQTVQAQINVNEITVDSTVTYKITLLKGDEFIGKIISKDQNNIVIRTSSIPRIEIPVENIKSIDPVEKNSMRNGSYWYPNPNSTRYFFSPSAANLKKGEGYYQNSYLLFNSVNYGLTDFLSIGGGFEILSTFSGADPIYFLTPKVGFEVSEKVHVGAGVLFMGVGDEGNFGIAYGLGTYGNTNSNMTLGAGWGFLDGEFSENPFITLSGMHRLRRNISFVSENWFVPDLDDSYYGLLSYGIRFFGEKLSVDLGFINNGDIAEVIFIGIPYVDFVVKF